MKRKEQRGVVDGKKEKKREKEQKKIKDGLVNGGMEVMK